MSTARVLVIASSVLDTRTLQVTLYVTATWSQISRFTCIDLNDSTVIITLRGSYILIVLVERTLTNSRLEHNHKSDCRRGLDADQKTLAAHAFYAMTGTTALTAQNTLGSEDVHVTPPVFVAKQIYACLGGMLAAVETG
jgi:hypothetical protein